MKDPRDGVIAPDAFLVIVHNDDGTPQTPELAENFECLQETGDFCEDSSGKPNLNIPDAVDLEQNYPNPFNPSTRIHFTLKEAGHVTLRVLNVLGQEVATLVDGQMEAGRHAVVFHGRNLPTGLYLYQIQAGDFAEVRKMILLE